MRVLTASTGLGRVGRCTGNSPVHCQYVDDSCLQLAENQHQLWVDTTVEITGNNSNTKHQVCSKTASNKYKENTQT